MTFRIPQQGKFSQPNRGDLAGNLNRTVGVDLKTNPGRLRLAARITLNTKDNDGSISGMGVPQAFVTHDQGSGVHHYAMCGIGADFNNGTGKILVSSTDSPSSAFANDATSSSPVNVHADFSDMVEWPDGDDIKPSLFVSTFSDSTSQIKKLFTSWDTTWYTSTVSGSFKTNGGCKNMWVSPSGNLNITDDDTVKYVPFSTSGSAPAAVTSGAGTLNFYGKYRAIWGRANSQNNFISLMTDDFGKGTKGFMAIWDGSGTAPQRIIDIGAPCMLTGVVLNDILFGLNAYGVLTQFNNTSFVEVARLPVANQNIEMPGIYDDSTNNRWVSQRGMDVVDGKIRINVNNFVSTGVYVEDMPSGVWEFDPAQPEKGLYHVGSPCAASTDFGQQLLPSGGAGAIYGTKRSTATMLVGASYYTDSGSTARNGIFYDDIATNTNKHAIVTYPFLETTGTKDNFNDYVLRYSPMASTDSIVRKYRTKKKAHLPFLADCTWTATNTLTSTDNGNQQYASVGDEVEVVMGVGASSTAHITSISVNAGTYTIVLDDTIGQSSGSCKIKINNFQSLKTISAVDSTEDTVTIPSEASTKIQPKIEIRASGDFELDDLTITNSTHY